MSAGFQSKVDLAPNVACLARHWGDITIKLGHSGDGKWVATLNNGKTLSLRSVEYNTPEFAMADLANEVQLYLQTAYERLQK